MYSECWRIKGTKTPKERKIKRSRERDRARAKDFFFAFKSLYHTYIPPTSQVPENFVSMTKPVAHASFSMWHQEW